MEEAIRNLKMAINTLNLVTVQGKDNLNHLLASILAIEGVKKQLEALAAEPLEVQAEPAEEE